MEGFNSCTLVGMLGQDPKVRVINGKNGETRVASLNLATSRTYLNNGEKKTDVQWHNVELWGSQAEVAEKYLKKGSPLLVEGEIKYEEYEKDGVKKYITKIVGRKMTLLPNGKNNSTQESGSPVDNYMAQGQAEPAAQQASAPQNSTTSNQFTNQVDDDLPF